MAFYQLFWKGMDLLLNWDFRNSIWSASILRFDSARYSAQLGINGMAKSGIFASSGWRLPFLELQLLHAVTTFDHLSLPPLERGCTWSRVKLDSWKLPPQYIHKWASLRNSSRFVSGGKSRRTLFLMTERLMATIELTLTSERSPLILFVPPLKENMLSPAVQAIMSRV